MVQRPSLFAVDCIWNNHLSRDQEEAAWCGAVNLLAGDQLGVLFEIALEHVF
jgi:hypothetical protein